MNKAEMLQYLLKKIPDYSSKKNLDNHGFQFALYVYPFVFKGKVHPFIDNFLNVLEFIDTKVPDYSKVTIDKISKVSKKQFEQVIQIFGEIIVLKQLVSNSIPNTITLEPTARKNGKNPEYRGEIIDKYFALEVKTASLFDFALNRQAGLQITAQLNDIDYKFLAETGKVVNSNSLKILDYLKSANEKFTQYRQNVEYQNDFTLLFIIWDDYINEPISAIINSNCGLFTKKTFYSKSNFDNVDGVIVIRHIHQFFRGLQYAEYVHYNAQNKQEYEMPDWFDYNNPMTHPVFIQNPYGRKIPVHYIMDRLNALPFRESTEAVAAEYKPTDFIDWKRMLSVSGLYDIPKNLREKLLNFFITSNQNKSSVPFTDISFFNNISIDRIYNDFVKSYPADKKDNFEDEFFDRVMRQVTLNDMVINRIENIAHSEDEKKRRTNLNLLIETHFNRIYSTRSTSECPCNSGMKFGECCQVKLNYFSYTNYFDL
ncbi:SEC-C domain-containing protein [Cytobacillus gottheilii]|uniref:SEC-C domain-containing protein n=1 Tax=Cytobacillus gottheilii TaxID=859144 RepID=UPI002494DB7F|nr:SEC-C domain-containing protein [Cytobacillus gottheilii]